MTKTPTHHRLVELIRRDCLQFGEFTLASGKKSSYYLDLRKLSLSAEGADLLAQFILPQLSGIDALGGPEMAAVPIVGAVLSAAGQKSNSLYGPPNIGKLRGFVVRKEAKDHGAEGEKGYAGDLRRGDHYVLVEDVLTTHASLFKAAELAQIVTGRSPEFCVCVVDRGRSVNPKLSTLLRIRPLLTLEDLGIDPSKD